MKYLFLLSVSDAETGDDICSIEAYSQESLEEQLRKIAPAIKKYEDKKEEELSWDEIDLNPEAEKHND